MSGDRKKKRKGEKSRKRKGMGNGVKYTMRRGVLEQRQGLNPSAYLPCYRKNARGV